MNVQLTALKSIPELIVIPPPKPEVALLSMNVELINNPLATPPNPIPPSLLAEFALNKTPIYVEFF